ncbi:Y-family DNA polymerase [Siccirubricoccus deserti]
MARRDRAAGPRQGGDRHRRNPARGRMTARYLALYLPSLATDRIRRAEPGLPRSLPLATWEPFGNRRVLTAVDSAAADVGLRPGQALADAQAIAPDLLLRPADPAGDARALHALALWARRYTPLTAADPPDGLLLDITGCAHLLGGEAALLRDALVRLRQVGITTRGAVAGLPQRAPPWPAPAATIRWLSPASRPGWWRPCCSAQHCACPRRCWRSLPGWACVGCMTCSASPAALWPDASARICWAGWMGWSGGGEFPSSPRSRPGPRCHSGLAGADHYPHWYRRGA